MFTDMNLHKEGERDGGEERERERANEIAVTFHLFLRSDGGNCGNPVKPGNFCESSGMS